MSILTGTIRKICPECGKRFDATANWGYGIGATDYCGWTCTRAAERRMEAERLERLRQQKRKKEMEAKQKMREYDYEDIQRRRAAGESIKSIADSYCVSSATISVYIKKMMLNEKAAQAEVNDAELLAPPSMPELPAASPEPKASAEAAPRAPKASTEKAAPEPKASTGTGAKAQQTPPAAAWKALGMVEMALRWGSFPQGVETELRDALHTIENALECA